MAELFDKLRGQIDAGLTKITTKSRVALTTTQLKGRIHRIEKEKGDALSSLGTWVYQEMSQHGQLNQGEVLQIVTRIQEMDRSIEDLQKEITRLEAQDAATSWSPAARENSPIAICTCSAPLTERAKFCDRCGTNVQELIAKATEEQHAETDMVNTCSQCGAEVSLTARFCKSCGNPVMRETAPVKAEEPTAEGTSSPDEAEEQPIESSPRVTETGPSSVLDSQQEPETVPRKSHRTQPERGRGRKEH